MKFKNFPEENYYLRMISRLKYPIVTLKAYVGNVKSVHHAAATMNQKKDVYFFFKPILNV
jgi:hypothetical protein